MSRPTATGDDGMAHATAVTRGASSARRAARGRLQSAAGAQQNAPVSRAFYVPVRSLAAAPRWCGAVTVAAPRPCRPVRPFETLPVHGQVSMITNGSSNVLLQAGPQGVLLVDTLSEPDGARLLEAVRGRAGARPIRYVVNTHADADFTGGNATVAAAGSQLVAGNFAGQVGQRAVDGAVPQAFVVAHENVLDRDERADRRPAGRAVRRLAHRHVLPGRADHVLQRRGHSAGARARTPAPTATCWCSSAART